MAREPKLERIIIPPESRVVKDWFLAREVAEAVIPAIKAHIKTTGETHTCFCHTHTKPPPDAVPIYIGEFEIPERFRKAKRFCPCPCCWDEFAKFGQGKIAYFPAEKLIRLIGPDCFAALNPEAHAKAQADFNIEQERKRNTEFLLSNLRHVPDVISTIERAVIVAQRLEEFHGGLHGKLKLLKHHLWPYVRRGGELNINVREQEFRRDHGGEMYAHEIDVSRSYAILPGYQMLDPDPPRIANSLQGALERIRPYNFGNSWTIAVGGMDDARKRSAADQLSRSVRAAKEKIAQLEELRRFAERASINTLRRWGAHEGCPVPYNYSHDGNQITVGRSDYDNVVVPIPGGLMDTIGQIEFWTEMEPRHRR